MEKASASRGSQAELGGADLGVCALLGRTVFPMNRFLH